MPYFLTRIIILMCIFVVSVAFCVKIKIGIALFMLSIVPLSILHRPAMGLYGIMFCIPFDRLVQVGESSVVTLTKVLLMLTFMAWLVWTLVEKRTRVFQTLTERRTSIMAILFAAASMLALASATDMDAGVGVMVKRIGVVGIYLLVLNMVTDRTKLNRSINWLLFASFFVCSVGAYEVLTGDQVLDETSSGSTELRTTEGGKGSARITGPSGNPDFHAAILIILMPLLIMRMLQAHTFLAKSATIGLILFYLVNILWTNSRMGLLGAFAAFGGVFMMSDVKGKFVKMAGAFSVAILLMLILALDSSRFSIDRFTGATGSESIVYRISWIKMAWQMGLDHPILGVGLGNWLTEYHNYTYVAPGRVPLIPEQQHNGFAHVWCEMGIIGLVSFVALMITIPLEIFTSTRHVSHDEELRQLRNACFVSFLVYLFVICTVPTLEHEVGWLVIGFAMVIGFLKDDQIDEKPVEQQAQNERSTKTVDVPSD